MTGTILRFATSALLAATVVGTALAAGAGSSTAISAPLQSSNDGEHYNLYCYQNAQGRNSDRLRVDGFRTFAKQGVFYQGRTELQTLNGKAYVIKNPSIQVFIDVWVPNSSANTACGEVSQEIGVTFNFGYFV